MRACSEQLMTAPSDSHFLTRCLKPHSSSQKSLELLNAEIKRILKEASVKLTTADGGQDEEMKDPTTSNASIPISDEDVRSFLLTLLSFHPDK